MGADKANVRFRGRPLWTWVAQAREAAGARETPEYRAYAERCRRQRDEFRRAARGSSDAANAAAATNSDDEFAPFYDDGDDSDESSGLFSDLDDREFHSSWQVQERLRQENARQGEPRRHYTGYAMSYSLR